MGSTPFQPRPRHRFLAPTPPGSGPAGVKTPKIFFNPDPAGVMTPAKYFDPGPGGVGRGYGPGGAKPGFTPFDPDPGKTLEIPLKIKSKLYEKLEICRFNVIFSKEIP